MRVKIGDKRFSSEHTPICIKYTETERRQIRDSMAPNQKYAQFPDTDEYRDEAKLREWMREPGDK